MKIHRNLSHTSPLHDTVVTVGTFDGVHKGHMAILDILKNVSRDKQAESVVVTFDPHPRHVVPTSGAPVRLINSIEERIEEFKKHNIDHLVIIPFTKAFSQMSPESYIQDFLLDLFHPRAIVVGFDHKFGYQRKGDIELLKNHFEKLGIDIYTIDKKTQDDVKISSTFIRNAIKSGDIQAANERLGYPFYFSGTVQSGDGIGSSLGFPTANIQLHSEHKIFPAAGIYAALAYVDNKEFDGLLYIGKKSSINEKKEGVIEIHLKNFSQDIYQKEITVKVLQFIRGDQHFDSKEALVEEIKNDDKKITSFLESYKATLA